MEHRVYLFDNSTLVLEFLNDIQDDSTRKRVIEILEVPRPDCGEYEPEHDFTGPFFFSRRLHRMFRKHETNQKRYRHNRCIRDLHNANRKEGDYPFFEEDSLYDEEYGTKVFIVVIKSEDESVLNSLDDKVWISGGSLAVRPASFFYERAKKIVVISSSPLEFKHLFRCNDGMKDSSQDDTERFGA